MGRTVRIILAFILLVLLIQFPLLTTKDDSMYKEYEVKISYPIIALMAGGIVMIEISQNEIPINPSDFLDNPDEIVKLFKDEETYRYLNIAAFIAALMISVFLLPAVGSLLAFFTRWGFVLVAVGMGAVSLILYTTIDPQEGVTFSPAFYAIWAVTLLGIIAGGSGKRKEKDKS